MRAFRTISEFWASFIMLSHMLTARAGFKFAPLDPWALVLCSKNGM